MLYTSGVGTESDERANRHQGQQETHSQEAYPLRYNQYFENTNTLASILSRGEDEVTDSILNAVCGHPTTHINNQGLYISPGKGALTYQFHQQYDMPNQKF
jgi:hypothetical protein